MSSIGTGYDLSASMFSPAGRVFQVEYATKAVDNSGTALALVGSDGVVFAVEYIVASKLHEKAPHHRLFTVDSHVGMATAGLLADGRLLANTARNEAREYLTNYGGPIPPKLLNERLSAFVHDFTLKGWARPVGASALLGSFTTKYGAELFMVDPSGVSWGYHGCAIGKGQQAATSEIEKLELKSLTCRELVKQAAKIIYQVHDDVKDKDFDLFLSWVSAETNGKHQIVPADVLAEATAFAQAAMEAEDDD